MTPLELSVLHQAAFPNSRPWSEAEFIEMLAQPHTQLFTQPHGFALLRIIAKEAEILTIAVHPDHRGKGIAHSLMLEWQKNVDAHDAFLEVAADNLPALGLYTKHGFAPVSQRKGYYRRKGQESVDAIIFNKSLTI